MTFANDFSAVSYLLQILEGNARKVSAVRFERINSDDAAALETKVTRLVPKIMKRKWSSDAESDLDKSDEDALPPESGLSDAPVRLHNGSDDTVSEQ